MIRLLAIGQSSIEIDGKRLTAESEIVFGILLYVSARAGESIARDEVQDLFWPDLSPKRGRHCLRQALYRLRQLGVPLQTDNSSIRLSLGDVEADYLAIDAECVRAMQFAAQSACELLPGYRPDFSTPFSAWVEEFRSRITSRVRQVCVQVITDLRTKGRYREAEPIARACLTIDPLNEVATLTLAEAIVVLSGNRAEAVAMLDKYLDEVGGSRELRLTMSASILRRRISERFAERRYASPPEPPFVGREDVLQLMVEKLHESTIGRSPFLYLWGEPGIGKSRLVAELTKVAVLNGVQTYQYAASPSDADRSLSLFSSLLPTLIQGTGALATTPASHDALKRFVDPRSARFADAPRTADEAAQAFNTLKVAICELFEALADERPIVLVVDDLHWLDDRSLEVLSAAAMHARHSRVAIVVTSRYAPSRSRNLPLELAERACIRRVAELTPSETESLLMKMAEQRSFSLSPAIVRETIRISGGNPLFVSQLATHYAWNGVVDDLPHDMQTLLEKRLDSLGAQSLLVLQACALLAEHATADRICSLLGTPIADLAAALQELELAGILVDVNGRVACRHALLAREALDRLPLTVATALHAAAASAIGAELSGRLDLALAQACLGHMSAARQPSNGIRLAIDVAHRFIYSGMPVEACSILTAAEALHPRTDDWGEFLAARLLAARAAGDWKDVNRTLLQIEVQKGAIDQWSDGEIHRIAFDAKKFVGASTGTEVASQLQLLNGGDLSASATKRVAINALIACCDNFDRDTADDVFTSYFNAPETSGAEFDDLVGNLIFHTSFGSLEEGANVALAIASKCLSTAQGNYKQTQLLRWCSQPFHNLGETARARSLLARARELATANGQPSEVRECRALEVMHALDLEDASLASVGLAKLVDMEGTQLAEYPRASQLLLRLRHAVLQRDLNTALQCMSNLERSQLPDGARARLTISCCRLHAAALANEAPNHRDVSAILEASPSVLSSIDMDWNVLGLLAVAPLLPTSDQAVAVIGEYILSRRPRFPLPTGLAVVASRIKQGIGLH